MILVYCGDGVDFLMELFLVGDVDDISLLWGWGRFSDGALLSRGCGCY